MKHQDYSDIDYVEHLQTARAGRYYSQRYGAFSECRDPDHPGCWKCEPEEFEPEITLTQRSMTQ
ncbi:hypothetical protein [Hahella ganghwensis]|uniref:hypothetical protein n=1 Tax=Hahella ganghwensis TaxID=286420 RepID=UPI00037F073D|nr:hypothetical protein [Hahella ganghwensis]